VKLDLGQRSKVLRRGSGLLQSNRCEASRVDLRILHREAHSESVVDDQNQVRRESTHFFSSTRKASLGVNGDEMDRTEVEAKVHVESTLGLRGGHAEASVVRGEVAQLGSLLRVHQTGRV
jgi:hypothetical protein